MRFGLIGYGAWGKHHAAAIAQGEETQLVAICCKSEASRRQAEADHPGVEVTLDYRELLRREDVEAVDIVLPTFIHAQVGTEALDAGKHVLLEKPMAGTAEECDGLLEAARRNNKVLTIGHEFRVSKQWGKIKDLVRGGEIGSPQYAMVSLFRHPYRKGAEDWRYDRSRVGSWILEEPIHFFDFILWFFEESGDPLSIRAYGNSKKGIEGLYDNFSSVLKFSGGSYAVITQTLGGFEHHLFVEIVGSEGAIRSVWSGAMDRTTEPQFSVKLQRKGKGTPEEVPIEISGELFELQEEIKAAAELFAVGKAFYPPEEGRKVVIICLEAERSLRENREIALRF
jgi:myo-inositol 2-dehydrogenase/D-chiro-inositol 1-dehydrogenase